MDEVSEKLKRVGDFMDSEGLGALYLTRRANLAWLTGGKVVWVHVGSEAAIASILITPDGASVLTYNIEHPRLFDEELSNRHFSYEVVEWHEVSDTVSRVARNLKMGADKAMPGARDVGSSFARLRYTLLDPEIERYRILGRATGEILQHVAAKEIEPGLSELEIAAAMAREYVSASILPVVILVATDERIFKYRHPFPTQKKLDRYAMLVVCARRWGLVAAATRLVHFGPLPDDLRKKHEAVIELDANLIAQTRPGTRVTSILKGAAERYASAGYADEWRRHHQGGAIGYEPREYLAVFDSKEIVNERQAFAWNPSITGTKSEDTIIVMPGGNEIITLAAGWPTIEVGTEDGAAYPRPAILER